MTSVRVATWNIRAGGGKRIEEIARAILDESADLLVLTEYRPIPGRTLLELLAPLSLHVCTGVPDGPQNSVCVLSRSPLEQIEVCILPKSAHRWVCARVPSLDLNILGVHVPNQDEVWNKREFWDCVEAFASATVGKRSLIIGDLNTALDEDCEGAPIREAVYFKRLVSTGWVDAWRLKNPNQREFSWYSHKHNGFRIDHCLVSPSLAKNISRAVMNHDVRTDRLSDHSLLSVDLRLRNLRRKR